MTTPAKELFYVACIKVAVGSGTDVMDLPEGTFRLLGRFNDLSSANKLFPGRYPIAIVSFAATKPRFISWALEPQTP